MLSLVKNDHMVSSAARTSAHIFKQNIVLAIWQILYQVLRPFVFLCSKKWINSFQTNLVKRFENTNEQKVLYLHF